MGKNVADRFKTLCGESEATSLVGIVRGLTMEEVRFVDSECDWSKVHHRVSWWMRPTHLKMLHKNFSPMPEEVWNRCPSNTNAVERKIWNVKTEYRLLSGKPLLTFTNWTSLSVPNALLLIVEQVFLIAAGVTVLVLLLQYVASPRDLNKSIMTTGQGRTVRTT